MRRLILVTSAAALLTGCLNTHPEDDKKIQKGVDQTGVYSDQIKDQEATTSLVVIHGQYTSGHMVKRGKEAKLPAEVRNKQFGLGAAGSYTIDEMARAITDRTGIPIRIVHDDINAGAGGGDAGGNAGASPGIQRALDYANSLGGSAGGDVGARGPTIVPNIEGTLPHVFDDLAERYDFDWTVDQGGTVVWNTGVTDVISVPLPPQKNVLSNTIAGATDSTGPSAGSSSQDSGFTVTLDPWETLQKTASGILGHKGFAIADRASSFLVVRATPRADRQFHQWYDAYERSILARVGVEVTVFYVDITDSTNFGFDFNAAFNSIKGPLKGLSVGLTGVNPNIVGAAGSQTIGIVNAPAGSDLSQFNGTQAILSALAQTNKLVDARTLFAEAQNNTQAAVQLTTKQDYLKNLIFNTTGLSGTSSTSTDVETLNYGFAAQVLPRIISRDQIWLTVSVETTGTPTLTTAAAGTSGTVQLATRDQRKIPGNVVLASGETQIVSGYDYILSTTSDQGIGQADFIGLGGSQAGSTRRIRAYLAIRATLIPTSQPNNTIASAAQ